MFSRGAIVTLSARGLADTRIAKQEIPWADIIEIAPHSQTVYRYLVLRLAASSATCQPLGLTLANGVRGFGRDRRLVLLNGLEKSEDELSDLIFSQWRERRNSFIARPTALERSGNPFLVRSRS